MSRTYLERNFAWAHPCGPRRAHERDPLPRAPRLRRTPDRDMSPTAKLHPCLKAYDEGFRVGNETVLVNRNPKKRGVRAIARDRPAIQHRCVTAWRANVPASILGRAWHYTTAYAMRCSVVRARACYVAYRVYEPFQTNGPRFLRLRVHCPCASRTGDAPLSIQPDRIQQLRSSA